MRKTTFTIEAGRPLYDQPFDASRTQSHTETGKPDKVNPLMHLAPNRTNQTNKYKLVLIELHYARKIYYILCRRKSFGIVQPIAGATDSIHTNVIICVLLLVRLARNETGKPI